MLPVGPLLVAVLVLGHVCALAGLGHVEATASAQHGDAHDADAIHAASCEATRADTPGAFVITLQPIGAAAGDVAATSSVSRHGPAPSPNAARPPLFILHASLLI